MNWKQHIKQFGSPANDIAYLFGNPITRELMDELRKKFSLHQFPAEMEELLSQANGVQTTLNGELIDTLIWPADRMIEENENMRTSSGFKGLYQSFDHLFFFSDAGNGDLFAFEIRDGKFPESGIYVWNHEDDSRTLISSNLQQFIEGWISGTIKV